MSNVSENTSLARVVERAWSDPAFKRQLMADPNKVLTAAGLTIPAGTKMQVLESTKTTGYFILPPAPSAGELSDAALEAVAGGRAVLNPSGG
jgi:hypothetical protein